MSVALGFCLAHGADVSSSGPAPYLLPSKQAPVLSSPWYFWLVVWRPQVSIVMGAQHGRHSNARARLGVCHKGISVGGDDLTMILHDIGTDGVRVKILT